VKSRGKSDGHSIVRRMNASRLHPPVLLKKWEMKKVRPEGFGKLKRFNDLIGSRTRDLRLIAKCPN
jgi:hypothetical protein